MLKDTSPAEEEGSRTVIRLPLFPRWTDGTSLYILAGALSISAGLILINRYLVPYPFVLVAHAIPVVLISFRFHMVYGFLFAVGPIAIFQEVVVVPKGYSGPVRMEIVTQLFSLVLIALLVSLVRTGHRRLVRAYAETKRKLSQLSALFNLDTAILGGLPLNKCLELAAALLAEVMEAHGGVISYLDQAKEYFEVVAVHGLSPGFASHMKDEIKQRVAEGAAGWAVFQREPVGVGDILKDPRYSRIQHHLIKECIRATASAPLILGNEVVGAVTVTYPEPREFQPEDLQYLSGFAAQLAVAMSQARLLEQNRDATRETIAALAEAMDARDANSRGHSQRVGEWSLALGVILGLPRDECELLLHAGTLHDVGKIGIPEKLLNKPGPLNPEETVEVQRHAMVGAQILSKVDALQWAASWVLHHHEHYDGTGYPDGLSGREIPIQSRILLVADCFDTLTGDRPYRSALPRKEAISELQRLSGSQLDPMVVSAFITRVLKED